MRFIKYTSVDVNTGVSVVDAPASNGPSDPVVKGLKYVFALESLWPTDAPVFFGTADDTAVLTVAGVLGEVSKAEFDAAQAQELADRATILRNRRFAEIPAERYRREIAGLIWSGVFIATDEASQAKLTSARASAKEGLRVDGSIWKCGDPQTGEILYRPTTNAEMLDIGSMVFDYIQSCYDREGVLMNAVKDGTYTDDMLTTGWPERGSQIQLGA